LPKSWRISLSISHHSSLNINILRAPATVLDDYIPTQYQLEHNPNFVPAADNLYINEHRIDGTFGGKTLNVLNGIMDAVKGAGEWFDKSDSMSDYYHVAFYIHMRFGSSSKDCELVGRRRTKPETADLSASPNLARIVERNLDRECADHADDRANVVPMFRDGLSEPMVLTPLPLHDFSLAEKLAIARAELIRRYKSAFAATPVGATLNEYSLSVLAEAALKVVVD
jgi:hypothetical protein